MSTMGNLTRDEVISRVGLATVSALDAENCDFTNRVQTDGDTRVEFSASVDAVSDDEDVKLVAYYYQEQADVDACQELDQLDWAIQGYEIV
jgi:hypothetical protein